MAGFPAIRKNRMKSLALLEVIIYPLKVITYPPKLVHWLEKEAKNKFVAGSVTQHW